MDDVSPKAGAVPALVASDGIVHPARLSLTVTQGHPSIHDNRL